MSALPVEAIEFRRLHRGELTRVARIESDVYPFPWTLGNFIDAMQAGNSCWACDIDGELIGYAVMLIAANEAHLLNITVVQPWQGQGIGARFLSHLLYVAKQEHAGMMYLEVRPSNAVAQHLYERAGFHHIAVRPKYYPSFNGREDALILGRNL
jgi:[ribosomal protein S18]-alanine N-acetyltransferase